MPNLITSPRIQLVDAAGTPYIGAKLYVYATGTTTPVTTYSNVALTIANSNPLIADTKGFFPPIYANPNLGVLKARFFDRFDQNLGIDTDPWFTPAVPLTQAEIGAVLYDTIDRESAVGFVPDRRFPYWDLRRAGVVGDGVTDDTDALANAAMVGGWWLAEAGLLMPVSAEIAPTRNFGVFSNQGMSTGYGGGALNNKPFFIQQFGGNLFNFVGDPASNQISAGSGFRNMGFLQNSGDGSDAVGRCIRLFQLSDILVSHWFYMNRCDLDVASGKNQWVDAIYLDGTAASGLGPQLRDCWFSELRITCGTHARSAIYVNGSINLFLREIEANLANADLYLTGTASRVTSSPSVNHCTFSAIHLDYCNGVRGAGNSASNLTATANTTGGSLECNTSVAPYPDTSAASRFTLTGLEYDNVYRVRASGNYEILSNDARINTNLIGTTDSGTFTGTLTGFSADITGITVQWRRTGHWVTLNVTANQVTTSTSAAMTLGGLPVGITPSLASQQRPCIGVRDNGNPVAATVTILSSGSITFGNGATGAAGGFTTSGSKGLLAGWTLSYEIG